MAALKYSKQRASIKEYLLHTTAHPTADTVYLHIKEEFPNISLGTVNPRLLELYKTLCRHVYYKYPALVGEHTALFRLQFEETEDGDTDTEESCKQKSIAEMKKVPQNLHS